MHLVSKHKLGLTQTSRDAFAILLEEGMLDRKLAVSLMNMVGFRNVAVHYYQSLDVNILESIIEKHMKDFLLFTQVRSEEHTSELQSRGHLVCRLLLENI